MVESESSFKLRTGPPPASADVVVIGAGVIGCGSPFRLDREFVARERDVL
jgi:glycine/D-amino acid oxidase-like deaminating enzyme